MNDRLLGNFFSGKLLGMYVLALSVVQQAVAQTGTIIPPSPTVATLQRFIDYPVDYATGLVNVSVPIYDIKLKNFDFPISISFHASGRRWASDYSPLGVGWSLNATGYVSREVRERPDELYQSLEMTADSITQRSRSGVQLDYDRLINADMSVPNGELSSNTTEWQKEDPEHDLYSYNVNGLSGKFIYNAAGNVMPLSYSLNSLGDGVAGIANSGGTNHGIGDDKGNDYTFGLLADGSGGVESTNMTIQANDGHGNPVSYPENLITGSYLASVTTQTGGQMKFFYGSRYSAVPTDDIVGLVTLYHQATWGGMFWPVTATPVVDGADIPELDDYYANKAANHVNNETSGQEYTIVYVQEIDFNYGKVLFTYDNQTLKLLNLKVVNNNGELIRNVVFNYIQTPGSATDIPNNNSTSLSSVQFVDAGNQVLETYSFSYYDDSMGGGSYQYPTTDWWGYCNTAGNEAPFDPVQDPEWTDGSAVCLSCKAPNFNCARSGMLKTVTYPSGGTTEFIYEPNMYTTVYGPNPPIEVGPGLRIQEIISDDGTGVNKLTRQYKYGLNEDGAGTLARPPTPADFVFQQTHHIYGSGQNFGTTYFGDFTLRTFSPFPVGSLQAAYQEPVYYDNVAEYQIAADGTPNGKTVYNYSVPRYDIFYSFPASFRKEEWTGGKLLQKTVYKYNAQLKSYNLEQNDEYGYSDMNQVTLPQVRLQRNSVLHYDDGGISRPDERNRETQYGEQVLSYFDFPYESAAEELFGESHATYDDAGNVLTTGANYTYGNPQYLVPTIVQSTDSRGVTQLTETQYTSDLYFGTTTNWHNIILPVEVSKYVIDSAGASRRLIGSTFTNWNPQGMFLNQLAIENATPLTDFIPATIQSGGTVSMDSRYVEQQSIDGYDSFDNPVQQHKLNDVYHSYIWDYNGAYPICEAINAVQSDIAYTSFEADGSGNWTIPDTIRNRSSALTGNISYTLASGTLTKSGLNSATTYLVSYWQQNGSVTVSGSGTLKTGITLGGWTYHETTVSGATTVSVSGSGTIDELKLYPSAARMSTYTFDPLVGMTSHTDASGHVTYYTYDGLQRLTLVRDQYGNILKRYNYQYQSPNQ